MRLLLSLIATTAVFATPCHAQSKRPNVLFIAVDDLNDWPRCMGKRPDTISPNIDKLAKRGTLFKNAHCPAPACNPSRAAILTGKRPSTSGVYHNSQPWRPAMPDAVTLMQYLMRHGYLVAGGGKIFHGGFNDAASWQVTLKGGGGSPKPAKVPYSGIEGGAQFDWGPLDVGNDKMGDHQIVNGAIDFLKQKHDKAFFLAVGFAKPHLPFYAPKKYFDMYPLDKIEVPKMLDTDLDDVPAAGKKMAKADGDHKKVLDAKQWKNAVQAYLACITFMDDELGRLLDALAASSYGEDTIIIFWGDHGWHLGEKLHWRKFALWEEATRTTMIMVAPGTGKSGQECSRPVNLMDMHPTIIELCGLPTRKDLEARSLLPLLRDPKMAWATPTLTTHGRNNHALRDDRWRYIRYADGSEELYDHDADPLEWKNLAGDAKFAKVKGELAKHLPSVNAKDAEAVKDPEKKKKKAKDALPKAEDDVGSPRGTKNVRVFVMLPGTDYPLDRKETPIPIGFASRIPWTARTS